MSKLRVASFGVSLDGFGAGADQGLKHPLGVGGAQLHEWFYPTRTFQRYVMGKNEGTTGVDDEFAATMPKPATSQDPPGPPQQSSWVRMPPTAMCARSCSRTSSAC